MSNPPDPIATITGRLQRIEDALQDCQLAIQQARPGDLSTTLRIHRSRTTILFVHIAHLEDDVRRWAKAAGVESRRIEGWRQNESAPRVVHDVANSEKHGKGGRSGRTAALESHVAIFVKAGDGPSPQDKLVDIFWLIVDKDGQSHQSNILVSAALHQWLDLLGNLGVLLPEWNAKWAARERSARASYSRGRIPWNPFVRPLPKTNKPRRTSQ